MEAVAESSGNGMWLMLIKGLALFFLGLIAVVWPGLTLIVFALVFAIFLLVDGVVEIINGITVHGKGSHWVLHIILGVIEIAAGVYLLNRPAVSVATFILVVGFVFLIQGVVELLSAFIDKGIDPKSRTLLIVTGVIALLAGIVVLRYPASSGIAFAWVIGVYALISGAVTIARSFGHKS